MKYIPKFTLIPVVALLVAGCSSPTAIQSSTETDDLYYASTDKTVYASPAPAEVVAEPTNESPEAVTRTNPDEVANPDYTGTARDNSNTYSDYDYYSDDYTYASRIRRFNSPYRGLSYYDFAYTDPYWYGSSFYAYDPFYDSFYAPGFRRPGFYSGLSLGLSFGNPFYSPFGGYGGFNRGYGGYYNGYQNGFYNGFYNGYYANGGNYDRYPNNINRRSRNYGPRAERSVVPTGDAAGGSRLNTNNGGTRLPNNPGGRPVRISGGGLAAPNTNTGGTKSPVDVSAGQPQGRPGRIARNPEAITPDAGTVVNPNISQPARTATGNSGYQPSSRPARRAVERMITNEPAPTPPSFPTEVQRQSRPARVIESRPRNAEVPRYEAPRREQRSPEIFRSEPAPQRNDSWSQPSRSTPSSAPSNSGGSSGGGRPRRN